MDTLTHALSGMLVARASHRPPSGETGILSPRTRMAAGFLAAAFPDIDFIFWFFGDLAYLNNHRGWTHSIVMLPIWALLLSVTFAALWRGRYHWRQFYVISALGIGAHILGDIITAYGTMILAPFSMMKFAFPTTFILDPWFSGIILLALLLAWGVKQYSRVIAGIGLVILVSFVAYQASLHQKALAIAKAYANNQGWQTAEIHALPQFLLPYHWKLLVIHLDQYHVAYVNVARQEQPTSDTRSPQGFIRKVLAYYQPQGQLHWLVHERYGKQDNMHQLAREIWSLEEFRDIRKFMKFPALDRIEQRAEGTCGVFIDHRFVIDGVRIPPFQFGACRNQQQNWQLYRFKAGKGILVE